QHVDQDVPAPSRYVPGLPPALDELVVRATRRDPGARPTDAGAMLAEVQDVRDDLDSAGRPAGDHTTATLPRYDSDATLLVPGLAADRPAWARLPAPRTQTRAE